MKAERSEDARLLGALEEGLQMASARNVAAAQSKHDQVSLPAPTQQSSVAGPAASSSVDSQQQTTSPERPAAGILTVRPVGLQ